MITKKETNCIRYFPLSDVKNIIDIHGNFIDYLEIPEQIEDFPEGWKDDSNLLFNIMTLGFKNPIEYEEYYYEVSLDIIINKESDKLVINNKVKSIKLIELKKYEDKIREELGKKYLEDIKKVREEYEKKIDDMRLQRDKYVKESEIHKIEKEEVIREYNTLTNDFNALAYNYKSLAIEYRKIEKIMYDICIRGKPFTRTYT